MKYFGTDGFRGEAKEFADDVIGLAIDILGCFPEAPQASARARRDRRRCVETQNRDRQSAFKGSQVYRDPREYFGD